MKMFKKMLSFLTALALCLAPLLGSTMQVQAEGEPTTYHVKYVNNDTISDWRFQTGGWKEDGYHRELYYLKENIKDGDKLVIEGTGEKTLNLEVNVHLSEVTFFATSSPVVTAKGIDTVYGLFNSIFAVNGDVGNAYLYEFCVCNFNNNVKYLEAIDSNEDKLNAHVYVQGTVDHAKAVGVTRTLFDLYSIQAGCFRMEKGAILTKADQCSATPPAATPAPETPAAPATPSTPETPTTPSTGGEYDDVPKTADARFNPLWLVGCAVVCFAGGLALRKEK